MNQFKLRTILIWMAFLAIVLAVVANYRDQVEDSGFLAFAIVGLGAAWTCAPYLLDRIIDSKTSKSSRIAKQRIPAELVHSSDLALHPFWSVWMTVFVGVYSLLAIMLSSVAFLPHWKGDKGHHWIFYMLDGPAGATYLPIYLFTVCLFIRDLSLPTKRIKTRLLPVFVLILISLLYVLAAVFLRFVRNDYVLINVPLSVAVAYTLYAILIYQRHIELGLPVDAPDDRPNYLAWTVGFVISTLLKIPLAIVQYRALSDKAVENCFVVTAAARGTPEFVGSTIDSETGVPDNQQLRTLRRFEDWLREHHPKFQFCLRRVYNILGPLIANSIIFKWQANLMYLLIKPLELLAHRLMR